jgi:hypothetical protein
MRINNHFSLANTPKSTEAQKFLKEILDLTTANLSVDIKPNVSTTSDEVFMDFFERYYVKPNTNGSFLHGHIKVPLSNIEAEILNFFLSEEAQSTPFIFMDHAGRGKTTILKYIAYYLFLTEKSLSEEILPIYISLRAHETTISKFSKAQTLHSFFKNLIKEKSFASMNEYFINNSSEVLEWINSTYHSPLQGLYPPEKIVEISNYPAGYIENLADTNTERLIELMFGTLCYYSTNKKFVVLFLDDADNFPIDVQRALIDFAKQTISLGIKALVALRISTWRTLESDRRDYEPYVPQSGINWSIEALTNLLLKRLKNAQEVLTFQTDKYKMDATRKETVESFVKILSNDKSADFVVKTSNYNLHSLMRKLALIPKSLHFEDDFLLEKVLRNFAAIPDSTVPLWVTFNLIFGVESGTFRSDKQIASSGLINCFCTKDDKHEPYTFFIRAHILIRLKDATDEGRSIRIREIRDEYMRIFGNNFSFSRVFRRAFYRLVQAGLVNTMSCRRYQTTNEVSQHIETDAVFITEAGLYYLNWLMFRIDYFHFMKDDINWPDKYDIKCLKPVLVGMSRTKRHKFALKALGFLMEIELKMLEELQEQLNNPGDHRIAQEYVTKFSAQPISSGTNEVLITKLMLDEFLKYLQWSNNWKNYKERINAELDAIHRLLDDYDDIRSSFR